jgi:hypothetical protein
MKKRWIFAAVLAISACAVACREQEETIVPRTTPVKAAEVPIVRPSEGPKVIDPAGVQPVTDPSANPNDPK